MSTFLRFITVLIVELEVRPIFGLALDVLRLGDSLGCLRCNLAEAFLDPLDKVKQIFSRVFLLPEFDQFSGVVNNRG